MATANPFRRLFSKTTSMFGTAKRRAGHLTGRNLSLESLEKRELLTVTASAWATDSTASEALNGYGYPSNSGKIAVQLSEASSFDLPVRIDLSGTAAWHPGPYPSDDYLDYCPPPAGVDWVGMSSVPAEKLNDFGEYLLTFPAGETYAVLEILPFDDSTYEGVEYATITVVSNGSAYSINPSNYAGTVSITDNDTAPVPFPEILAQLAA